MGASVLACEKYAFSPTAKTITFNMVDFNPAKIKQITNVTDGVIIYCPQMNILGTFTDSVLTLNYDTTAMYADSCLQVSYDWEANYHKNFDESFGMTVPSGIDERQMTLVCQGVGQTVSQANGSLVVALGTTINTETIIRGKTAFSRNATLDIITSRSQNNANNKISYGLYDVIGDNLPITVNSATSATVTVPKTSKHYKIFVDWLNGQGGLNGMNGQFMTIGALANVAGAKAYQNATVASASFDTNNVYLTFTVASWIGGSTGTCTLFGWNSVEFYHDPATTANVRFDCCRNGRLSGYSASGVATQQTTSTVAVKFRIEKFTDSVRFSDSQMGAAFVEKISRMASIISEEVPLYPHIITRNGSAAPTATTLTVGAITCRECNPISVSMDDVNLKGASSAKSIPVLSTSNGTTTITGTVNVGSMTSATAVGTLNAYSGNGTTAPATSHHSISTASTNATAVKATAGNIVGGTITNNGAEMVYFKIYNKATAPSVGSDIPIFTIGIPKESTVKLGDIVPLGHRYSVGISYAITGGMPIADATAVGAAQVSVGIFYA